MPVEVPMEISLVIKKFYGKLLSFFVVTFKLCLKDLMGLGSHSNATAQKIKKSNTEILMYLLFY